MKGSNMSQDTERQAAHTEAVGRYGPVPDYATLPYHQVVAFEHGASWQRSQTTPPNEANETEKRAIDQARAALAASLEEFPDHAVVTLDSALRKLIEAVEGFPS